jgi:hypothetical protein
LLSWDALVSVTATQSSIINHHQFVSGKESVLNKRGKRAWLLTEIHPQENIYSMKYISCKYIPLNSMFRHKSEREKRI